MRFLPVLAVLCASLASLLPAQNIPLSEYRTRRETLRKDLDGTVVLFAKTVGPGEACGALFLPHRNEGADAPQLTGFHRVLPMEKLESELSQALRTGEKVCALPHHPGAEELRTFPNINDAAPLIATLRIKKSETEIAAIQHATGVSLEAHRAGWNQIAATFTDSIFKNGCERYAYSPLVGSARGEVLVMDAAAECGNHAGDVTRTIPAGGKFGAKYYGGENSIAKIAQDYINSHGTDLHGEPLEAGMIFTVEPGIYIPEESIGYRIEDVVLVTDQGAKILSAALPREADEVETALTQ